MDIKRFLKIQSKKAGLPPGSLVYTGKPTGPVEMSVIQYDENTCVKSRIDSPEQIKDFLVFGKQCWINIDGLSDIKIIEEVGRIFNLHPLTLEDILNTNQRPKLEDLDEYLYIVLNMLRWNQQENAVDTEQVSFIVGRNYVISLQEATSGDVFDAIRDRLNTGKGKVRKMGSDYLVYMLIDAIIDSYFAILEKIAEQIETIEDQLLDEPNEALLHSIHGLKRLMIFLRKSVWPLRELINGFRHSESELVSDNISMYLADIYDHTVKVIDTLESFRDVISGMTDLYMSSLSNKTNAVMKVLTIIATIFIPLTFIVGIYGMNFQFMPELSWRWGYPLVLGFMLVILISMVVFFKKKDWF